MPTLALAAETTTGVAGSGIVESAPSARLDRKIVRRAVVRMKNFLITEYVVIK
jgi:hypothetical protein